MKKIIPLSLLLVFLLTLRISAQDEPKQRREKTKGDSIKTGWNFGAVPVVAYDRDVGFKYGGLVNFYHFGDGSRYPLYNHSLYFEISRTTKGSGINQFTYDSDRLLPGIRTAAEVSYLTEQALDFYGFNGYKAQIDLGYSDDEDISYRSRMFYRQDRRMLRLRTDFAGNIIENRFKWFGGIEFYSTKIDTVDIERLNKGQSDEDKLPYVGGGLYGMYAYDWNIIPENEISGGKHTLLKAGVIYDTRDNEPNPMKGIWTEAILIWAPSFLSSQVDGFSKLSVTHRQYFTIIPRNLNFAYRLSYQGKLTGHIPSYMLPFVFNSPPSSTRDGLGSSKTVRGVLRNRVVGDGIVYGNLELRWKFVHFQFLRQNFYLALNTFLDGGMVVQEHKINTSDVPPGIFDTYFSTEKDKLHLGYGAGFHIAWNENFIIAVDFGRAAQPANDGGNAPYIALDFLF